jgi:DNA-binding NarL/FixJ family response regulator
MKQTPRGGLSLDGDIKRALAAFPPIWSHPQARSPHYLTDSELRVLKLIRLGMTNNEIGEALFISSATVREHAKKIYSKCDIKGRARLAVLAFTIWDRGLWVDSQRVRQTAVAEERANSNLVI